MNIRWKDNCPTQYKCSEKFWKVALSGKSNKANIIHKLTQQICFKGLWDATGKLVKEAILNSKLRFDRCATVFDCYMKMKCDIGRDGEEKKALKLLK